MKRFLIAAFILNLMLPTFAISYEDIKVPKPPAYRTGLSEDPEKEYMEAKANLHLNLNIFFYLLKTILSYKKPALLP